MKIEVIAQDFAVCKMADLTQLPKGDGIYFLARTDEELSLVCAAETVPPGALACESGWRAFRVQGVLDFSLVGILAALSGLLARHNIGIFAVSTYNTDYILTKAGDFAKALAVLQENGYEVVG